MGKAYWSGCREDKAGFKNTLNKIQINLGGGIMKKQKNLEGAMQVVYEELASMTPEEFHEKFARHKSGDISKIVKRELKRNEKMYRLK